MKQAEFIAACYWQKQELSLRSLYRTQDELNAVVLSVKMACLLEKELR